MEKHLENIIHQIQRIAEGHYNERIKLNGDGGVTDALGASINMLFEEIEHRVDKIQHFNEELKTINDNLVEATETIQREKAYTEKLLEIVPSAIFTVDYKRRITSWNRKAEEITGITKDEILGKECTYFALSPCAQHCGLFNNDISKPIRQKECTIKSKNGDIIYVIKNVIALKDNNGKVTGGIESFEDLTMRIRMENELKHSKDQYSLAVDGAEVGIWDWNLINNEAYFSPRLEEMMGLSEGTIKSIDHIKEFIHPEDLPEMNDAIEKFMISKENSFQHIFRIRHANNQYLWVSLRFAAIRNQDGQPIRIAGSQTDITDMKKMELELSRSNKELEQFAYVASHDLQEPLRKVQAFSSRLTDKYKDLIDQKGQDYFRRMQSAANRMQIMVNDLLTYSRVTTKANPFKLVDLNEILKGCLDDLDHKIQKTHAVITSSHLPLVEADSTQITQVFNNLIGNSLKYVQPDVSPIIEIKATNNQDGSVTLTFKDHGIGFDMNFSEMIFQAFQRLHGRQEYEGSGIGLAVVKKIIERHKGEIWVESSPEVGSTFFIQLPIKHEKGTE